MDARCSDYSVHRSSILYAITKYIGSHRTVKTHAIGDPLLAILELDDR